MADKNFERRWKWASNRLSRRQFLQTAAVVASGVAANSLLAACAPVQPPSAPAATTEPTAAPAVQGPQYGGEVTFGIEGDPVSLAPFGVLLGLAHEGKELAYDSLVEYDRDLNVLPALATSWEHPDDRTTIFHLRKGVTFHDGKEFKAEDVVYSVELQPDPTSVDPSASAMGGFMPDIESVEALDDFTVKITTPTPDATLLGWFAWARWSVIASEDIYDLYDPSVQVNGTGPFKLVEYIPNDRVVYEKNPNFWKPDQPYVDRITLKVIPDESARVAAVRSGDIDATTVSSADIVRPLEADPDINIFSGVTGQTRVVQVSVKGDGKQWDDKRVRQAMSMAINRQDIIDKVYGGKARLTAAVPEGWGPYGIPADDLAGNPYLQYNLERAKELLAEAGYPDGFQIGMITVTVPEYESLAEIVQENLSQIGIQSSIDARGGAEFSAAYRDGSYELFVNAQGFRADPVFKLNQYGAPDEPPQSFWYDWPNGWRNERLEELYDQAVSTFDPAERVPLILEAQRMGLEEATFLYLVVPERIDIVRSRVKNWFIDFMDFNHALRTIWVEET